MPAQVPFTAHIKVVPQRGLSRPPDQSIVKRGGRFDYIRSLGKLSALVYSELLNAVSGTDDCGITIAEPGGSCAWSSGQHQSIVNGTASTPQFGNKPSLLMIEGFYCATDADPSDQPHPAKTIIHANALASSAGGGWPWLASGIPTTQVEGEVKAIKDFIESNISTISDDSGQDLSLFRLLYKGITWGDRGHHFPR